MAINFPNISRSYDESHQRVHFWGYDGAFEVSFFIDLEALSKIQTMLRRDEASVLGAFDSCRARVISVAEKMYRGRHRVYRLVANDF